MIVSIVYMPDKTTIIREAQKYLAKGQIDKAIAEWEKIVSIAPDANTHNTVGDLYLRKGDRRSAVESFHKAAKIFREEGFSLKALALYKKIINIDSSDADALTALGELSEEKGLVTDAIKYYLSAADLVARHMQREKFLNIYDKILALAPFNIPLRDKVAGLFLKEGLITDAATEYNHIAKLCLDRGDAQQAKDYFMKVLEVQSGSVEALLGLSSLFEKSGDSGQALTYAKMALSAHPDKPEVLQRCAMLLKESGLYGEAVSCLSKILELQPFNLEIRSLIGDIYRTAGDREKAWESYKEVVDSLVEEGRLREAAEIAKDFRDLDPVDIGKLLLSLYRRDNEMDAAFEECIAVADLLSEGGSHDEALSYYREALKIHPDDIGLKKKLAEQEIRMGVDSSAIKEKTAEDLLLDADVFLKYGLYDDARAILEDLKMRMPDNIDIHMKLKSLYLETDDRELAVTECLILSEIYGKLGEVGKRDLVIREALGIDPGDARLLERVGAAEGSSAAPAVSEESVSASLDDYSEDIAEAEFYTRQGLYQDALRIYQKLLSIFPDREDFRKRIATLQGEEMPEEVSPGMEALSTPEGEMQLEEFALSETESPEPPRPPEPQFDSDVLDIFEEFKKGLEKELEAEDYETHYNLGIAYKEMGLTDDAIKEFQTSRKDRKYLVRSLGMLGICYMEKGLFPLAIDAFKNALEGIETRDESYWGAMYDLATAYEKNGNLKEALDIFSEIYGIDSKYREVTERLNHIRTILGSPGATVKPKEKKDRVSYL